MSFEHQGLAFNRLDTPGHEDFSEGTYRTLTGVDSAGIVLDSAPNGAKGASRSRPASSSRSGGWAMCRSSPLAASSTARARPVRPRGRDRAIVHARVTSAGLPNPHHAILLGPMTSSPPLLLYERGTHDPDTEPVYCRGLGPPNCRGFYQKSRSCNFACGSRSGAGRARLRSRLANQLNLGDCELAHTRSRPAPSN